MKRKSICKKYNVLRMGVYLLNCSYFSHVYMYIYICMEVKEKWKNLI